MYGIRSRILVGMLVAGLVASVSARADAPMVHIIPASELQQWWQPDPASPNAVPAPTRAAVRAGLEGCFAVAFQVDRDGGVSHERIWKTTFRDSRERKGLEAVVLDAVRGWHFIPAPGNPGRDEVYTTQRFTFTVGADAADTDAAKSANQKLAAPCVLPDFPQQVQDMINSGRSGKAQ